MKPCLGFPGRCRGRWEIALTRDRALLTAVSWNSPEVHTKNSGRSSPLNKAASSETKACGNISGASCIRNIVAAAIQQSHAMLLIVGSIPMSKLLVYRFGGRSGDFSLFFNKRVFFSCFCHWQVQGLRRNTLFLPIGVSPGIRLAWTWLAVFRAADGLRSQLRDCMTAE